MFVQTALPLLLPPVELTLFPFASNLGEARGEIAPKSIETRLFGEASSVTISLQLSHTAITFGENVCRIIRCRARLLRHVSRESELVPVPLEPVLDLRIDRVALSLSHCSLWTHPYNSHNFGLRGSGCNK